MLPDHEILLTEYRATPSNQGKAVILNALALNMTDSEKIVLDEGGVPNSRVEVLIHAITLDPTLGSSFAHLASVIAPSNKVLIPNLNHGKPMTQHQLYLHAASLHPSLNTDSVLHIAYSMGSKYKTTLHDGRTYTKRELLLLAHKLNESRTDVLFALADSMASEDEEVTLPDGRSMPQQGLFFEILRINSRDTVALNNLALMMGPKDKVTLANGQSYSQRDLFLEAVSIDPKYADAYYNLARTTSRKVTLKDGRTLSQQQLFLEALALSPRDVEILNNLALSMSATARVTLPDGRSLSQRELFFEVITIDEKYPDVYYNLARTMSGKKETMKLPNGRLYTMKDLFEEHGRLTRNA
jgi:tetratricopeptide (TPR) repeat protein